MIYFIVGVALVLSVLSSFATFILFLVVGSHENKIREITNGEKAEQITELLRGFRKH
jgi:hypothetical protein